MCRIGPACWCGIASGRRVRITNDGRWFWRLYGHAGEDVCFAEGGWSNQGNAWLSSRFASFFFTDLLLFFGPMFRMNVYTSMKFVKDTFESINLFTIICWHQFRFIVTEQIYWWSHILRRYGKRWLQTRQCDLEIMRGNEISSSQERIHGIAWVQARIYNKEYLVLFHRWQYAWHNDLQYYTDLTKS